MNKYELGLLPLKQDIQQATETLTALLADITEIKKLKATETKNLLHIRNEVRDFDNKMSEFFAQKMRLFYTEKNNIAVLHEQKVELETNISNLRSLFTELSQTDLTPDTSLAESLVKILTETLSSLTTQIKSSETKVSELSRKETELVAIDQAISQEIATKSVILAAKINATNLIEEEKQGLLDQIEREKLSLNIVKYKQNQQSVEEMRSSEEYQEVYNSLPRRNKIPV